VPCPDKPTDHEKNTAELEKAEFVTANCACTKSVLESINGFDESFSMAWREDSDLEFKLLGQAIPILYVQSARVTHPVRGAGWGISLKEQKKSMYNVLLYKKHPKLFRRKIYKGPFWNYYAIVILAVTALVAFFRGAPLVGTTAGAGWAILTTSFIIKRLKGASLSFRHITEMIVTSMLIPFLSLFWTWYGAFRFKTFFL
jgi:GT2 family glycosyltransferase